MKGAQAFIETMIRKGVDTTFGYPGGSVIPFFDSFLEYEGKIKNVLVRHEQAAAHAADGFARASGKPGVCIATSGPGATNLVTGIMTAHMDSSPIIAIGGQVPTSLLGNDAFQESDMMGITIPITKHNFQIRNADECSEIFLKAHKIATEGRPGPVYIDFPKDSQTGETDKKIEESISIESFKPTINPNPIQIKKAAEKIINSTKPMIIAGGGALASGAQKELKELAHMLKCPVATTLMAKGIFDENDPLSIGMLGMHGKKIANYAALNCDLMIAIGCRFVDRITGDLKHFADECKVIHIDIDPAEIGKNVEVDVPIVGDAKTSIQNLIEAIKKLGEKQECEWTRNIKKFREMCDCNHENDSSPINPAKVIMEINRMMKGNDIACTGVGQHQMYSAHFMKFSNPRTFISSGGAGTMGFGFPAAIGAKVAKPESEVYDIDGDGSFQMTMQELGTISEENIKINPVILSNHYLGMVRQWLEIFFNKRYSQVNLGKNPDFVTIANAYGLEGRHVTRCSELKDALKEQLNSKSTMLLNVEVEQESNILPMIPPAGDFSQAFGGCMKEPGKYF